MTDETTPDTTAARGAPRQIDSLHALRGLAAVLVVIFHVEGLLGFLKLGPLTPGSGILSRGYLWVDFFFVLSGFIITHVYGDRFRDRTDGADVRTYLRARLIRIYPLHLFALGVSVLLYVLVFSRMSGDAALAALYDYRKLPYHLLLLLGAGIAPPGWNVPAWSIAAEWWTYLAALIGFRVLDRGVSKRTYVVPLVCAAGLVTLTSLHPRHMLDITYDLGLLRCLLDFSIGMCTYQFYRARLGARWLSTDAALVGLVASIAVMLHVVVPQAPPAGSPDPLPIGPTFAPLGDGLMPLAFALLVLCASLNTGGGRRVLAARPLRRLGAISYSIYMMQATAFLFFLVIGGAWRQSHPEGAMSLPARLGLLFGTVGVAVLIAMPTYRYIEAPPRRWLQRMRESPGAAAAS